MRNFKDYILENIEDIYEDYLSEAVEIEMQGSRIHRVNKNFKMPDNALKMKMGKEGGYTSNLRKDPSSRRRKPPKRRHPIQAYQRYFLQYYGTYIGASAAATYGTHAYLHRDVIKKIMKAKKSGNYNEYYRRKSQLMRSYRKYSLIPKRIANKQLKKYDKLLNLSRKSNKFITKL